MNARDSVFKKNQFWVTENLDQTKHSRSIWPQMEFLEYPHFKNIHFSINCFYFIFQLVRTRIIDKSGK